MNTSQTQSASSRFGQPAPEAKASWELVYGQAENERAIMVSEFKTWILKKRIAVETELMRCQTRMRSIAPFASTGMQLAPTPADVPAVVIEFAQAALEVMAAERELALINVYFTQAATQQNDELLTVQPGNEEEINTLWTMFTDEREAG